MQHQSKFERLAGQLDEVSTKSSSDRVLDASTDSMIGRKHPVATALGTDLIALVIPSRVRMLPQFKQIYQE
jgi:hypothetical protein